MSGGGSTGEGSTKRGGGKSPGRRSKSSGATEASWFGTSIEDTSLKSWASGDDGGSVC